MPRFDPRIFNVKIVVNDATLGHVFLAVHQFYRTNIIPQCSTLTFIYSQYTSWHVHAFAEHILKLICPAIYLYTYNNVRITKQIFMKNGTGELYENLFNFHFEWTTLMSTLQETLRVFVCIQVFASLLYPHTFISLLRTCTAVTN